MFRPVSFGIAILGLVGVLTESAHAQKVFRGTNTATAPPSVVFPAAPPIPMLNNGSLQTTANPNSALPNQVPFIYIAGLGQDARLNNNGVFIWQPRLDSTVTTLQQNQNNNGNNQGGQVQAFGAMRGSTLGGYGYPGAWTIGYDAYRAFMGTNFSGFVSQVQQPLPGPMAPSLPNANFAPVNAAQANFFTNLNPPGAANAFANLGNFGGDANPFDAFKVNKADTNDGRKKNDEDPDKEKKILPRKDEDADKQR